MSLTTLICDLEVVMTNRRIYLYVEVLPSTLPEFGIGGQPPPHAIPVKYQKGTGYASLELNCIQFGTELIAQTFSKLTGGARGSHRTRQHS